MNATTKILISFGTLLLVIILGILLLSYLYWRIFLPPKDNPYEFVAGEHFHLSTKKRVVCIGDSLTHGNMSTNYVKMLCVRLGTDDYHIINAGLNAELTYNILKRLESIIACKPDFVTLLIGTNDVSRQLHLPNKKRGVRRLKLPQEPDEDWFASNLIQIITELQEKTEAKIGLCSIPPMGEDQTHEVFLQSSRYANIIADIATKTGIPYLPVHEKMIHYLNKNPTNPKHPYERRLIETTFFQFYFLGMTFNKISERNGFSLLIDHVHLNSTGAKIITDLLEAFILTE
ncbi:MAG: SGNH/GDSL hydrolase family protein [Candidatus Heimdallarchaeota archaeon]